VPGSKPGRYGGVIGSKGNCCASAVKTVNLDGPSVRRRISMVTARTCFTRSTVKQRDAYRHGNPYASNVGGVGGGKQRRLRCWESRRAAEVLG
jgi:hypothetical protein